MKKWHRRCKMILNKLGELEAEHAEVLSINEELNNVITNLREKVDDKRRMIRKILDQRDAAYTSIDALEERVNSTQIMCAHCGKMFPNTVDHLNHWETCPNHPAYKRIAELESQRCVTCQSWGDNLCVLNINVRRVIINDIGYGFVQDARDPATFGCSEWQENKNG